MVSKRQIVDILRFIDDAGKRPQKPLRDTTLARGSALGGTHVNYASDYEVPPRDREVNRHTLVPLAWRKRETMVDRLAPTALAYFLVPVRHIRSIGFHGREECAVLIGPNANREQRLASAAPRACQSMVPVDKIEVAGTDFSQDHGFCEISRPDGGFIAAIEGNSWDVAQRHGLLGKLTWASVDKRQHLGNVEFKYSVREQFIVFFNVEWNKAALERQYSIVVKDHDWRLGVSSAGLVRQVAAPANSLE